MNVKSISSKGMDCKVNNVNPQEWLTDILIRIQDHNIQKLDELLPTSGNSTVPKF